MRTILIAAAAALLSACATAPLTAVETPVEAVDLLLTSATVVDVEKGTTTPDQLVAVRGGDIVAVRPENEANRYRATRTQDLGDRYVMPGLWDMHVHFGGGPDYCCSCAENGLPCSKGETNKHGDRCPYTETEPQTMEGWQAWDIALRCAGQLRTAQLAVIGIDMNAAIKLAEVLMYDIASAAELLPACESGMITAINEKICKGMNDHGR